jgi:hypothetical protein
MRILAAGQAHLPMRWMRGTGGLAMKTPEEIKVGLACEVSCNNCPYFKGTLPPDGEGCGSRAAKDALAYIAQLEETIQLMMIQMRGDCGCCMHGKDGNMTLCSQCLASKKYHPLWEYEGLPEVKRHDKPV